MIEQNLFLVVLTMHHHQHQYASLLSILMWEWARILATWMNEYRLVTLPPCLRALHESAEKLAFKRWLSGTRLALCLLYLFFLLQWIKILTFKSQYRCFAKINWSIITLLRVKKKCWSLNCIAFKSKCD